MTQPLPGGRPYKLTVKVTAAELDQAVVLSRREDCTLSEVLRRALLWYGEGVRPCQSLVTTGKSKR
jgi:hypothetical protein